MEHNTRQRNAILSVIAEAGRPFDTGNSSGGQAVAPSLSIATVYRTLKDLPTEGRIVPLKLTGEADRYELTKLEKHYHFKCSSCSKVLISMRGSRITIFRRPHLFPTILRWNGLFPSQPLTKG